MTKYSPWLILLVGALLAWWWFGRRVKASVGLAADEGTVGGRPLQYAPGDLLTATPSSQQLWDFANTLPVE